MYLFLKLSINTQLQFQGQQKHERGVFILELQIGKTYILTEDEKSDVTGTVFIKKGSRVRVKTLGSILALVQDLSAHKTSDGIWSVKIDKLVTPEEYEKMLMDDEVNVEQESPSFGVGDICIMKRPEVSGNGIITYLKKGARVRIENLGRDSVVVQDLSDDRVDDGVWMTHASYLMPLAEASASAKNTECFVKKNDADIKNKHYVSDHQPIETMQSNMTHDEMIGFLKGNIIKYACRCGKKDEPLKEAEKIKQYAEWLCIVLSGGTINPRS